jgi:phosphoribosylamine--glycine ligase/phosphoribosylaminoimidazole synthetase
MNILLIGGGGREHALAWKLAQSTRVTTVFVAPGNAGTALDTSDKLRNVPIAADDIRALLELALEKAVELTVVGPEAPLAAGIVDVFQSRGLNVFGPAREAAQLEASKAFAKEMMREAGVPTAAFQVFDDVDAAIKFVHRLPFASAPGCVVKADGLAAGKGVFVCDDVDQADEALTRIMIEREFGDAGAHVVVEERMSGPEVSMLAFCDGARVALMPPARDHKRIGEGDSGPNTGGMGAFAPAPDVPQALLEYVKANVLQPIVDRMRERGTPYVGVLYAGLMLTADGPRVLEFNCRFGDPEAQVILPLLDSDLVAVMQACVDGALDPAQVRWRAGSAATVVLAAPGYPGAYPKGAPISGLGRVPDDVTVFHAGTSLRGDIPVTAGGRVLNVTAAGADLRDALARAYAGVQAISFDGMYYRRDIAHSVIGVSSYAAAGVNIAEGARAVELMKAAVRSTHDARVLAGVGAFGAMFDASALKAMQTPVLVASTDGVGTKTKVAAKLGRWDTVGQDLVNHCVNDILVQGAQPLFFMDYVAAARLDAQQVATVVSGMAQACRESGLALLGGETAEMPGVYVEGEIDLAGTIVGVVDRDKAITGRRIAAGDVIIGLASTGLHTNGYSLARRALADLDWNERRDDLETSIGEALLAVHRSYLPQVQALLEAGIDLRGLAHITGGGLLENVPRILPDGLAARFDTGSWSVPPIFALIQAYGRVEVVEMYRAFNMGLGMVAVVPERQVQPTLNVLQGMGSVAGAIVPRAAGAEPVQLRSA